MKYIVIRIDEDNNKRVMLRDKSKKECKQYIRDLKKYSNEFKYIICEENINYDGEYFNQIMYK